MKTTPLHSPNRSQLRRGSFLIALGRRLALLVFLLCAALLVQPCAATPFQWEFTGSLKTARDTHTATLLSDGRVLVVAGSSNNSPTASAELYDPATGTWTLTGSLNTDPRFAHTATLLADGRVLVVGGFDYLGPGSLASAALYNPATGTWTVTGSLHYARDAHTATLLSDGRVLVAGGEQNWTILASAELYDPVTGTWTLTGSLSFAGGYHTATLLPDGRVLVAGGGNGDFAVLARAELYDPATGTWTVTGSLNYARDNHTATLLSDGKVLVAGGADYNGLGIASSELYDPAMGNWTVTGSLNAARWRHTATLLSDGKVLVAAGVVQFAREIASAELYDPAEGSWSDTGSLNTARWLHTATLLPNGKVLVTGGWWGETPYTSLASAELHDPVAATHVDGLGAFDNQGNEVTFRFRASQAEDGSRFGLFDFCDPAAGVCVTNARIWWLSIRGNTAEFNGPGRLEDETRVRFRVRITNNGWPGTLDTISISLDNGYSTSGTLTSGNIRIY